MVRPEIVRRKLSHLSGYLREPERHRNISFEEYVGSARREVERLLQLIVEAAADVNVHVVTEIRGTPPPDYFTSFAQAAEEGILPHDLAVRLAPSAGLRNVLVHDYAETDDPAVYRSIPEALDGFAEYGRAVLAWVERFEAQT